MKRTTPVIPAEDIQRQKEYCAELRALNAEKPTPPLAYVDTYGCQQNEADSERIRGYLTAMGCGFTDDEKAAGISNYVLGCTHITEGAIPFAAKNPLVVLPILMLASSISAVLTYMMKIQVPAPHGGFLILPLVSNPIMWVVDILIGSAVGAVIYGITKKEV